MYRGQGEFKLVVKSRPQSVFSRKLRSIDVLENIPALLGALKALAELAKEQKNAEVTQKVIELQQYILELQNDMLSLQSERARFESRILQLEQALNPMGKVVFADNVTWVQTEEGKREGPFCPHCFDSDKKFIHLNKLDQGIYFCPYHPQTHFVTSDYSKPKLDVLTAGNSLYNQTEEY
jgi:hypothetical protein